MKNILMISSRFPYPIRKGDQAVIVNRIKILSKKYKIIFLYFNFFGSNDTKIFKKTTFENVEFYPVNFSFTEAFFKLILNIFKPKPFSIALFDQSIMKKKIRSLDLRFNFYFYHIFLLRLYANTKSFDSKKRVFYELIDSMALNYDQLRKKSSFLLSLLYRFEFLRVSNFERNCLNSNYKYIMIATKDASFAKSGIKVFPPMIDLKLYNTKYKEPHFVKKIVFSGNLGYLPNVDAITQFIPVFLKLKTVIPNLSFYILGSGWSRQLDKLVNIKGIFFRKNIKNMIYEINKYDLYVAPISLASGAQNKIIEALAANVPTIITKKVAKPLNLIANKHCLIADNVDQFYDLIFNISRDLSARKRLVKNGYKFLKEKFSLENFETKVLDFFK